MKKTVYLMTATSLVAPAFASASEGIETPSQAQVVESAASVAALNDSTKAVMSLIIATSKIQKSTGRLVAVDPAVAQKYTYLRTSFLGGVPTSSVTLGAVYLGKESVEQVEFVLKPLTLLLRGIQKVAVISSQGSEQFLRWTGLDNVLIQSSTKSADSLKFTYNHLIEPVLRAVITKNTALSSGSISASASATGSIFFIMNDTKDAMTYAQVRSILGQDRVIRSRIDQEVRGLSEIYNLSADQQNNLKVALFDEILRQAIANNFSEDSSLYNLDIIKIMLDKNIIDSSTAQAVAEVRSAVSSLTQATTNDESTRELTIQNVDLALQLAALLESQLAKNNVKDAASKAEIERMLGSVAAKLSIIGFNLKK